MSKNLSRKKFLLTSAKFLGALGSQLAYSTLRPLWAITGQKSVVIPKREIPSTGEKIPIAGLGTYRSFDCNDARCYQNILPVYKTFLEYGGGIIDSSPMYGESEKTVGKMIQAAGGREKLFAATKVWTSGQNEGLRQIQRSSELMECPVLDLVQVHNLLDYRTHLKTLLQLKERGKIRYIGVTHYMTSSFGAIAEIMKKDTIDFIQIPFSVQTREAEHGLLSAARKTKTAVLVNMPFGQGSLFSAVRNVALPGIAHELECGSWAQLFLKYIFSFEEVTCVIPATSKTEHLKENMEASLGPLPNEAQRRQILSSLKNR